MSLTKLTAEWDYGKYGSGILTLDIPDGSTVWEMGDYFRAILHVLGFKESMVNAMFAYNRRQYLGEPINQGLSGLYDRQTDQTKEPEED